MYMLSCVLWLTLLHFKFCYLLVNFIILTYLNLEAIRSLYYQTSSIKAVTGCNYGVL